MKAIQSDHRILIIALILLLAGACKKKKAEPDLPPKSPKEYTAKMSGKHKMVGRDQERCWYCTPEVDNDVPMEINCNILVINDSTLSVDMATWQYYEYEMVAQDSVNKYLSFYGGPEGSTLTYHYFEDSIVYYHYEKSSGRDRRVHLHTE